MSAPATASTPTATATSPDRLLALPHELQLCVAALLEPDDQLAVRCTCRAAEAFVRTTHCVAVLKFKLREPWASRMVETAVRRSLRVHAGPVGVRTASPNARVKGHIAPLYQSLRPDTLTADEPFYDLALSDGDDSYYPGEAQNLSKARACDGLISLAVQIPKSLARELCPALGFSSGCVSIVSLAGAAFPERPPHYKETLVYLDLGRIEHLTTACCAGLSQLREARLPRALRVADFGGCTELRVLHAAGGCASLLSAHFGGCRRLPGSALGALSLCACEELVLASCAALRAADLEASLRRAAALKSLDARSLALSAAALDALRVAAARTLVAADFAFARGLADAPLLALVDGCAALARCNLRGAKVVSTAAYNDVGRTLLARQQAAAGPAQTPDVVENRRRPRHLAPRAAAPFYYLKRTRRG